MIRRTALVGAALVLAACQHGADPFRGRATASTLAPPFELVGDVRPDVLQDLADAGQATYREYVEAFAFRPSDATVRVHVFGDLADFGTAAGTPLPSTADLRAERRRLESGGWLVDDPQDVPRGHLLLPPRGGTPVISVPLGRGAASALRHELAHVFLIRRHGDLPAWLDEGIAEHLRLRNDPGGRDLALAALDADVRVNREVPLDEVLALDRAAFVERLEPAYRTAWLLVDHLVRTGRLSLDGHLDRALDAARAMAADVTVEDLLARRR